MYLYQDFLTVGLRQKERKEKMENGNIKAGWAVGGFGMDQARGSSSPTEQNQYKNFLTQDVRPPVQSFNPCCSKCMSHTCIKSFNYHFNKNTTECDKY